MSYRSADARQELNDAIAEAVDELAVALAGLGAAYEQLDERTGDRLEETLFGPVQKAYGLGQRTHAAFAQRHGLRPRRFVPATTPAGGRGVQEVLAAAVDAAMSADELLITLQDSMKPVEVGDPELRAGLAAVREQLAVVEPRSRDFLRTFGR